MIKEHLNRLQFDLFSKFQEDCIDNVLISITFRTDVG